MKKFLLLLLILCQTDVFAADDFNRTYCEPFNDKVYQDKIIGTWQGRTVNINNNDYSYFITYERHGKYTAKLVSKDPSVPNSVVSIGAGKYTIKKSQLEMVFVDHEGKANKMSMLLACMGPYLLKGVKDKHIIAMLREHYTAT